MAHRDFRLLRLINNLAYLLTYLRTEYTIDQSVLKSVIVTM